MSALSAGDRNESNIRYSGNHRSAMSSRPEDVEDSFNRHIVSSKDESAMPRRLRSSFSAFQILISALSGLVFGVAMEKGRVYEPQVIRMQMLFYNFTMLKMFLSATAVGMISMSLLSMIPATTYLYEDVLDDYIMSLVSKSVAGAAIGGALLGCGMSLAGACPGMVLAQVGAAVPDAMLTVIGGLCGAYLYALTEPVITRLFQPKQTYCYSLDDYLSTPYFIIALPLGALIGMSVFALELFRPWTSEVIQSGSGVFESRAWPPFVAGILIGSLQIPTVMSVRSTLGSSTGYMYVASQILVVKPLQSLLPHLQLFQSGVKNWWQVVYMGGAIVGAHLSARSSGALGSVSGVGPWWSFFGGILMIYGSRMAGGCTSGHGLSGVTLLMLLSFVAVPSMFAGGISTAVLMKYVLNLEM